MIWGSGLIGTALRPFDRSDATFFAAGISDSTCTDPAEFARETALVNTALESDAGTMVYFSTASAYDPSKADSPYVAHKIAMEKLVARGAESWLCLRISNVVGRGGNPNLFLNYLVQSMRQQRPVRVYSRATRNLIDVADVAELATRLVSTKPKNRVVNIAHPQSLSASRIVQLAEEVLGIQALKEPVDEGAAFDIDASEVADQFELSAPDYVRHLFERYYL